MTVETTVRGGIGESVRRPDGIPKVKGDFAYSSDLWADGMLWGATLRSPHPRARIRELNIAPALAIRGVHAVLTHEDVPGRKVYGLEIPDQPVLAWDQVRYQGEPVAIVAADHPETARHAAAQDRGRLRGAGADHRPGAGVRRRAAAPGRQPAAARAHRARRPGGDRRRRRHRRVRGRHAGPGVPRPGVRPRGPGRGRRRRPVRLHAVAARRPRPGRREPRPAARQGPDLARRRRRRVRRARGPLDAGPRLPARAPHRQAGEDDVRARGVVLRPHPPPSGVDALRARRQPRRRPDLHQVPDPARRRRVRLQLDRRVLERGVVRVRAVRRPERADRLLRRLHRQPAVRGDARVRRRADLLRARGADGQARGRAGDGPGRAAAPQRAGRGRHDPDRGDDPLPRAGGRAARQRQRAAAAAAVDRDARRPREHDPRRGRAARRRLRGRLQERRLLGGLRRLLDRARAAVGGGRRAARGGPHRGRRGRPGPRDGAGADRPPRARRRARARAARRHAGRLGRLLVGLAPDLHDRRRGQARLRGDQARSSSAAAPARSST